MTTSRRIGAILIAFALTLTGMLSASSLAQASPIQAPAAFAPGNCPSQNFCGFNAPGYSLGEGGEYNPVQSAGTCENVVSSPNRWSSLWNGSGRSVRVYKGANCSGAYLQYANGTGEIRLSTSASGSPFENNIESYRWM